MQARLSRPIALRAIDCVMEIGLPQKREDIVSVLMLADERGGSVSAVEVCDGLLMGRPERMGELVLARCAEYGVLDRGGRLTLSGRRALEEKLIFAPERGRYRIHLSDDPLLPSPIVRMRPVDEPGVQQSVRRMNRRRRGREPVETEEKQAPIPDTIANLRGSVARVLQWQESKSELAVEIRTVGEEAIAQDLTEQDKLAIRWDLPEGGPQRLLLRGQTLSRELQPPEVDSRAVLSSILEAETKAWDSRHRVIQTPFKDVENGERRTFLRKVPVTRPAAGRFGQFDATVVEAVPLRAATEKDASQWARWLLEDGTAAHMSTKGYDRLSGTVRGRFGDVELALPTRSELARKIGERAAKKGLPPPAAYWYLQAPIDLEMPEGET